MTRLSTFKKYFISFSLAFLMCFTVIIVVVSILINNFMTKDKMRSLSISCDAVCRFIEQEYSSEMFSRNLNNIVRTMSGVNNSNIIIINTSGKVISCSCSDYAIDSVCVHSVKTVSESFLKKIDNDYEEIGKLNNLHISTHYTSGRKIVDGDKLLGYVFSSSPASDLTEFYGELIKLYFFGAIIPIFLLFFALYFLTYRWVKPLKLMSEASIAMAKGDFSKRIPVMSSDEIGQLAVSFNTMTNSLVELESMRRSFIANVSHELRTPMTTISGFIDGIIDGTIEKEKQAYYLNIVSTEIKRLSRLVQGMLSLSKLEAGEIEPKPVDFEFKKLLLDVLLSQEQRIARKKLDIVGLENIDGVKIYADKDLIHQVIFNLCDNAIKFTDDNGTISFSVKKDNSNIEFRIKNSGSGIPEKELPLIFDRFYKGDSSRSANKDSTGLGLYLVKTIVKIHNGNVFVESSQQEQFTEFGIRLPIKYGGKI
ncbi:MAG: HAMP domain-containing histidine kinase [Ruminococcaceae bacterium]|nr:HAMP domain-containing histidine kinase [Oscillospiraceae bacterium]